MEEKSVKTKSKLVKTEPASDSEPTSSDEEEETKPSENKMNLARASNNKSKSKTIKTLPKKKTPAAAAEINKSNLLLWAIISINTATLVVMSRYGYNYLSN